jgi:mannose-6-phosphate isomerase-like protein (cupin superfamily)
MDYIKKLPFSPSFKQKGLNGYNFDLYTKEISISVEDCFKGHDKYHTNVYSQKIYYVLDGEGRFKINGKEIKVKKDDLIEIPKNTEFVFAGKMKLLLIMSPAFRPQDGIDGKDNDLYNE